MRSRSTASASRPPLDPGPPLRSARPPTLGRRRPGAPPLDGGGAEGSESARNGQSQRGRERLDDAGRAHVADPLHPVREEREADSRVRVGEGDLSARAVVPEAARREAAYQAVAEAGLSIPGDVAVVSFDDDELAAYLRPGLTTVALPHEEMGRRAVELLLSGAPGERVLVPMPLVERASTRRV
ncbi:hypothetical protein C5C33_13745 [Rathayibacter sp. AY1H3]|nr:substrate-binding domain-containing protein [Rathayibacter sp. AY1H3]PPH04266.1 hypothetical protein C5C33_13745 [Rathayibacter sp. AY1H3]